MVRLPKEDSNGAEEYVLPSRDTVAGAHQRSRAQEPHFDRGSIGSQGRGINDDFIDNLVRLMLKCLFALYCSQSPIDFVNVDSDFRFFGVHLIV